MATLQLLQDIVVDVTAVLGALSLLFTALSHLPFFPPRVLEFFARVGLATAKFSVNKRPPGDPEGPGGSDSIPRAPKTPFLPMIAMLVVCFSAGLLGGCALFGAGGMVWPKLGACAPTPETLFSEVESVLTSSGGSYEDDLLALGKSEGLAFVECAVKAVVEALSARIQARMQTPGARITPDEGIGVARGKAFLAKIEEHYK